MAEIEISSDVFWETASYIFSDAALNFGVEE
jgi:hypothetical protein